MPGGQYFVYGNGGEESPYAEEKITRIAKTKVEAWIEEHKYASRLKKLYAARHAVFFLGRCLQAALSVI